MLKLLTARFKNKIKYIVMLLIKTCVRKTLMKKSKSVSKFEQQSLQVKIGSYI